MILVLKPLSNSSQWEEERFVCSVIFGKGDVQVCFPPLDLFIFKRVPPAIFWAASSQCSGWPAVAVMVGGSVQSRGEVLGSQLRLIV